MRAGVSLLVLALQRLTVCILLALVAFHSGVAQVTPPAATISLVSARDQIAGSLLIPDSVVADGERIYLAAYQGKIFVLARDRAANFPLIQTIDWPSGAPVRSVRGDNDFLYATGADGILRIYRKTTPLQEVTNVVLNSYGLGSLAVHGDHVYVTKGQGHMDVDDDYVYVTQLNQGEYALEVAKGTWTTTRTYGTVFEQNTTLVYSRETGLRRAGITNPPTVFGTVGFPGLYAADGFVMQTIAGCCGLDVWIYNTANFTQARHVNRYWVNTVSKKGPFLVAGTEAGTVHVYDIDADPPRLLSFKR